VALPVTRNNVKKTTRVRLPSQYNYMQLPIRYLRIGGTNLNWIYRTQLNTSE